MNTDFRPFAGFKLAISAYAAIWGTGFLFYLVMGKVVISTLLIVMALSVVVGWHINQKLKRVARPPGAT
jgi:hypothetical protein